MKYLLNDHSLTHSLRISVATIAAVILLSPALATAQTEQTAQTEPEKLLSAADFVDQASTELLATIEQHKASYDTNPEMFVQAIQEELNPMLDMRIAVRKVMGDYYKTASKEQRARFGIRFRDSLTSVFAKTIAEFKLEKIVISNSSQKSGSRLATVDMQATTSASTVTLTYYLYVNKLGEWKLYNIRIDGADLTNVYVGQFASSMATYKDIDQVINQWDG